MKTILTLIISAVLVPVFYLAFTRNARYIEQCNNQNTNEWMR